jgi:hypothetical protein
MATLPHGGAEPWPFDALARRAVSQDGEIDYSIDSI